MIYAIDVDNVKIDISFVCDVVMISPFGVRF